MTKCLQSHAHLSDLDSSTCEMVIHHLNNWAFEGKNLPIPEEVGPIGLEELGGETLKTTQALLADPRIMAL